MSSCKSCKEINHCCIFKNNLGFTYISPSEIKKIKRKIKFDFVDDSPLSKKVVEILKNCDPTLEGALRYSQLKNNQLPRLKKKNGRCIFLNDKNTCDIYDIRPNLCRIYPFWGLKLDNGKIKVIRHDFNSKCNLLKYIPKSMDIEPYIEKEKLIEIKKIYRKIIKNI